MEVKSNRNNSKSLRQLIDSNRYPDIAHGIKFTTGNIGIESSVVTLPQFCAFLLKRYMEEQDIFH